MSHTLGGVLVSILLSAAATAPAALPATRPAASAATQPAGPTTQPLTRTRAEVEALIAEAGKTPPDWWNSVPLNVPPGLDLTWKSTGKWDPQHSLGEYLWDIIHPNPGRWREGTRLLHQALTVNKNNPQKLTQTMEALATMYGTLMEDYPRGAFWARKAQRDPILLANCYWKMGSREMTLEILSGFPNDPTRNGNIVKLWSELGDLNKALALAQGIARSGRPDVGYLAAGDACRRAGQYAKAIGFYQQVLQVKQGSRDLDANKKRAQANLDAVKLFDSLDLARVPDGAYRASSMGYAGPIEVEVLVKANRIESVKVTNHHEKQFYAAMSDTPRQIIAKQSVKGIDATSSATITSEAIINATGKALAGGMK